MTVSSRKKDAENEQHSAVTGGIQYNCDFCFLDCTHTVRIKCAAIGCEEVDLCPSCFCKGKEGGKHKSWHPYRVVEQHSYPIYHEAWGADEELLLIEGLNLYGLGNWQDASEHVGTRTKEECREHYMEVWVGALEESLPAESREESRERIRLMGTGGLAERAQKGEISFDIDQESFLQRKKRRIEEMRTATRDISNLAAQKPLVSAPTNHEIAGFMPGRLDFEHEVAYDDAENTVKEMEFGLVFKYGGNEQPEDVVEDEDDDDKMEEVVLPVVVPSTQAPPNPPSVVPPTPLPPPTPTDAASSRMDLGEPDPDADGEGDDDDWGDDYSSMTAQKLPPPSFVQPPILSAGAGGSRSAGAKGLRGSSSKKAPPGKTAPPGFASPKVPPPGSSLPSYILAERERAASVGSSRDSATPEPSSISSTKTLPPGSTKTLPSSVTSRPIPSNSASGVSTPIEPSSLFLNQTISAPSFPSSSSTPQPVAASTKVPAAQPIVLSTDSPDYVEDEDDLEIKLAVLEIYNEKLDRRREVKNLIFQRGLTEHKKIMAAEKKRPPKDKGIIQKYKVFAKLQTAEDFEVFSEGLIYEQSLRTRISQLQTYRSKGITTVADAERYEILLESRTSGLQDVKSARGGANRISLGGQTSQVEVVKKEKNPYVAANGTRKPPQPLNLATSASLHLLNPAEQQLCSTLRILPKPYLMIKETLVREYARRGGNLRRREARGLIKIDVNKTAKIWDLLVDMGCFRQIDEVDGINVLGRGKNAPSPVGGVQMIPPPPESLSDPPEHPTVTTPVLGATFSQPQPPPPPPPPPPSSASISIDGPPAQELESMQDVIPSVPTA